jgi:hypothetical protein
MSQLAYERRSFRGIAAAPTEASLKQRGWVFCRDFPTRPLRDVITKSHLRVEVWTRQSPAQIAVAFGGTLTFSLKDWRSNLRWFIFKHNHEYTKIVKQVAPAFADEFTKRYTENAWAFLKQAQLYTTGHSLGGGLAQQFAYALNMNDVVPRVAHVFAFDPSPVTGFYSVDKATRDYNKKNLQIDRIYERREILAGVRSLLAFFYPPKAHDPEIRGVRYDLIPTSNPIKEHSISEFARRLSEIVAEAGRQERE